MTLAELKEVGAEVGIDGASLERAALAVRSTPPVRYGGLAGVPTSLAVTQSVPSTLDPHIMPDLVALIRQGMGRSGEIAEVHGMVEWRIKGDSGERVISLASRDGATTIQGTADLRPAVVSGYIPVGIVSVVAAIISFIVAADSGSPAGILFSLIIVPLAYLLVRTILRRFVAGEQRRLETVIDDLGQAILASAPKDSES